MSILFRYFKVSSIGLGVLISSFQVSAQTLRTVDDFELSFGPGGGVIESIRTGTEAWDLNAGHP